MRYWGNYRLQSAVPVLAWHTLVWPQELDAKQVHAWLQALGGNKGSKGVRFVVVATPGSITHYVALPHRHEHMLMRHLASFLPSVELRNTEAVDLSADSAVKLRMTSKNRVLDVGRPVVTSHAILSAIQALDGSERIVFEWVLGRFRSPTTISNNATSFRSGSIFGAFLEALAGGTPKPLDAVARKSMRDKYATAAWDAALFVGVSAKGQRRRMQLLGQITGAVKSAEAPGVRLGTRAMANRKMAASYSPIFWPLVVNVDELTGLLAWPLGEQAVAGLQRITSRQLPVPTGMPRNGRVIADSVLKANTAKLALPTADALMHLHVVGPTGVGKSTLLLNLITKDIGDNRGVVVVDPKGDLINEVLRRIPANRQEDVVVLEPSELSQPVGLNPLAHADRSSALVADDILTIFRKLYGNYFGPRTEDILHAGLLTLMATPGNSLCALPLLYTDAAFRARMVGRTRDPLGLGNFWNWYESLSASERNTAIAPVMNKLRPFLLRPSIRLVLGQGAPKFDVADVFRKRKILLVDLAKGTLGGEASQLFGSLVVAQVWQAAQTRATVSPTKRSPVFVYVDEMQDYLHSSTDIGDVLAQARSYGVGLTLAHQHLGQLSKELRSGVLANARSRVCFQLGHDDAVTFAKTSKLLNPDDFENLGQFEIYAKLVHNGRVSSWASGKTLLPLEPISDAVALRMRSRAEYGRPRNEVEVELDLLISGPPTVAHVIGRKKL